MALAPGFGEVVMHFTVTGGAKPYTCTFGFGADATSASAAQDCCDSWFTALTAASDDVFNADQMHIGWTFEGLSALFLSDAGLVTGSHFDSIAGTASTGSPAVPLVDPYNPMVISKRTAFAGRHARGRMYVPPVFLTMSLVDPNGIIDPTRLGFIQDSWDGFLTDVNATDFRAVLNHIAAVGPESGTDVTSLIARNVVGSQRRRKARSS